MSSRENKAKDMDGSPLRSLAPGILPQPMPEQHFIRRCLQSHAKSGIYSSGSQDATILLKFAPTTASMERIRDLERDTSVLVVSELLKLLLHFRDVENRLECLTPLHFCAWTPGVLVASAQKLFCDYQVVCGKVSLCLIFIGTQVFVIKPIASEIDCAGSASRTSNPITEGGNVVTFVSEAISEADVGFWACFVCFRLSSSTRSLSLFWRSGGSIETIALSEEVRSELNLQLNLSQTIVSDF
ncbi:uncharacterized protein [Physcomitrium patens]|uniref:uncharacterized protein n=1 Tax=Physcomitrium patens TaxID=3218 RepID=UPI003CCDD72D